MIYPEYLYEVIKAEMHLAKKAMEIGDNKRAEIIMQHVYKTQRAITLLEAINAI